MKNVNAILIQSLSLVALTACSSSSLKETPAPGREPAQAAGLNLRNEKQRSIVCANQEHTPDKTFHYVVQLRQRKGGKVVLGHGSKVAMWWLLKITTVGMAMIHTEAFLQESR